MAGVSQRVLDETFAKLVRIAERGDRCPAGPPFGPLRTTVMSALAKAGRIKIEVYSGNWRVVTIMEGERAGSHTMMPPKGGSGRPYRTVYKDHIQFRRGL